MAVYPAQNWVSANQIAERPHVSQKGEQRTNSGDEIAATLKIFHILIAKKLIFFIKKGQSCMLKLDMFIPILDTLIRVQIGIEGQVKTHNIIRHRRQMNRKPLK